MVSSGCGCVWCHSEGASMKPFFTYYGGKWRAARHYPNPLCDTIIEPFAGSAGYSVRHFAKKVFLIDTDPMVVATWKYLLSVSEREVRSLPDIGIDQPVDELVVCQEARWLIGWWLNKGSVRPKRKPSSNMRKSLLGMSPPGTNLPSGWWGPTVRDRIASQLKLIRHWVVKLGTYEDAPEVTATWFVDPPYQVAGKHYRFGSSKINYSSLSKWCKGRKGQVIVCENYGADWLPFRLFRDTKAQEGKRGGSVSKEVIWTSGLGQADLFTQHGAV
jgi:hypothetical protein